MNRTWIIRIPGLGLILLAMLLGLLSACQAPRTASYAAGPYYAHRYPDARDIARPFAADPRNENVVLDNLRLGLASLADGDLDESERALLKAYEYLISGGVNAPDRVVTSTLFYEGIRIWKGDPFEQAMAFYHIAALYMIRGDWENARAAAANSLFALRDFKAADMQQIADRANDDEAYLDGGFEKIESQFTLGYLLVATNYVLMNQPEDARRMFDHVRSLRPNLAPLADALQANQYDALLLIDAGRGPTKQAHGPDDALVRYVPDGRREQPMSLSIALDGAGGSLMDGPWSVPVVDLWTLSQEPRWWSLEDMRRAKSAIGSALLVGGMGATMIGSGLDSDAAVYAGLGAMLAGLALKGSSKADVRYLEMLPRSVFVVPLNLGPGPRPVTLRIAGRTGVTATWHDLRGGSPGRPEVYYLRMHDGRYNAVPWGDAPLYTVRADQIDPTSVPWLLGGRDLTPPSDEALRAYQNHGAMTSITTQQWIDAVRAQGFVLTPGPQGMTGEQALNPMLYRHVTEGGRALWTPRPGTHLYQRLTRTDHGPNPSPNPRLTELLPAFPAAAPPTTTSQGVTP
jgi:tetratricopeptide (TPR) repeat protein